jgi:hypothetical protein
VTIQANEQKFEVQMRGIKLFFSDFMKSPICMPSDLLYAKDMVSGVYAFSENDMGGEKFLYVGQAISIFNRLREHCALPNRDRANFAYMLTMDRNGRRLIPASPNAKKSSMFEDSNFVMEFDLEIKNIKRMNYRFIKVDNKLQRNLLEIYASVVLSSTYNDFA